MNELFINIKVDREERPDLDQIYQTAHQCSTARRGGWPLTMFLTPDQTPFFGGTYFPKTPRYGEAGHSRAPAAASPPSYREQRGEHRAASGKELIAALSCRRMPSAARCRRTDAGIALESALAELKRMFDETDGGFGDAPKFPHPAELEFCLRRAVASAMRTLLGLRHELTLTHMAERGLYDQLGGGFYRYCVDQQWMIPHFEKMLYDNGPLLRLYSDMWLVERRAAVRARRGGDCGVGDARNAVARRRLLLDARRRLRARGRQVLRVDAGRSQRAADSADEYAVVALHFGLDAPPNFEHEAWHLQVVQPLADRRRTLGMPAARAQALLDAARAQAARARERRVRPARDEKILTSWNALMIQGMAHGARVFEQAHWLRVRAPALPTSSARTLWRDGRLLATLQGRPGASERLSRRLRVFARRAARAHAGRFSARPISPGRAQLADVLLDQFEDREHGGFFFVSHDHEQLLHRAKIGARNDTPSGNSVAAFALEPPGPHTRRAALQRSGAAHGPGLPPTARRASVLARHAGHRARRAARAADARRV